MLVVLRFQRPDALHGMKISEFSARSSEENSIVVHVKEHKLRKEGPAKIHLDDNNVRLIKIMLKSRTEHKKPDDYVLCNADGSKLKNDFFWSRFNEHLKTCKPKFFDDKKFNSHDWRRSCNTKIYSINNAELRKAMDEQQTHSPAAALKYYLNTMSSQISSQKIKALRGVVFPQSNENQNKNNEISARSK